MLAGPANVVVRDEQAGKRLPLLPPNAKPEEVGYGRITDLTWEHLVSLDACTKCGKCHAACPATARGYPLSPRDVILDLREVARRRTGRSPKRARSSATRSGRRRSGRACSAWPASRSARSGSSTCRSSTRCAAGSSSAGELDPMLQQTLETIYETGNSFGEPKRKRARWAKELGFEVKDIRKEPAELLWFVGDYASFDPRNQRATRALARILHEAGVDFGILYDAERTAGCDVRRAGEEGLWALARRGEREDDLRLRVRADLLLGPAHLPHAPERVPGRSAATGPCCTTRSSCSSCSSAGQLVPRSSSATASPTTTRARSAATTASTTSRAACSRRSGVRAAWRCRATATTRSAAARAAGGSG